MTLFGKRPNRRNWRFGSQATLKFWKNEHCGTGESDALRG
jgi:hypothetical protein